MRWSTLCRSQDVITYDGRAICDRWSNIGAVAPLGLESKSHTEKVNRGRKPSPRVTFVYPPCFRVKPDHTLFKRVSHARWAPDAS